MSIERKKNAPKKLAKSGEKKFVKKAVQEYSKVDNKTAKEVANKSTNGNAPSVKAINAIVAANYTTTILENNFKGLYKFLTDNSTDAFVKVYQDFKNSQALNSQAYSAKTIKRYNKRLKDAGKLIKSINGNNKRFVIRLIRGILADEANLALNERAITKIIRSKLGEYREWQINRIARTESHKLTNQLFDEHAREVVGDNGVKVWAASGDSRTRPWHQEVSGTKVKINDTFTVAGEELEMPGQGSGRNAINCRCTLYYEEE